ncbi:MAG: hypothetical protein DRZ90_14325 [Spirochaetes bacterium]|nr:MAG: hypothetical protein DRZ90_14325 [Spirochaetota bacterium]
MDNRLCSIEGCERVHMAKGYCELHYGRLRRTGDPMKVRKTHEPTFCTIPGCDRKHAGHGYCLLHYRRFMKYGDPLHLEVEKHGMSGTPEYTTWRGMVNRCHRTSYREFRYYGGRGITVCDEWRHSFLQFYKDMGPKPFRRATIDRVDNNKGYSPNNCRWVSQKVNNENRRRNGET